jgi:TonB-linked SusC/RagA family outer membrane protein
MKKCIALVLMLLSFGVTLFAQNTATKNVKGKVLDDSTGAPLPDATITVARQSYRTDASGNFVARIPADGKKHDLSVSFTNYVTSKVSVDGNSDVNIRLKRDVNVIEDVVVIGYQTVKRKDLSGSVASVGAKELKDIPVTSAAEALNGRLAGVTATTSEGSPDASIKVRVRGGISITQNNDPLYVVDGVQVENALNVIAPQDIQTVDVLKDAAATAIYGARGANGVILITTKTGKPGRTRVTYDGFVGVKTLASKLDVLSPYDYVVFQWERTRFDPTTFSFGTTWDTLNVYKNMEAIDWQKLVLGQTGMTTRHSITASGGNKKATFNMGYTFNNEKPIVINSSYNRHIFNLKGDYKITKKIKVGVGGRYTYQNVTGAGVSGENNIGSSYGRLRNAVKYRPFYADSLDIDDPDPLAVNPGNGVDLANPVALSNAEYRRKSTNAYNLNANVSYTITKNLSFRSTFGYDVSDFVDRQFSDSISSIPRNSDKKPIIRLDSVFRKIINNSNVLTYSVKNFKGKHNFDLLLGQETYDARLDSRGTDVRSIPRYTTPNTAFENPALGTTQLGFPVYLKTRYTNLSFFSRLNYSFEDKYLLSLNVRRDGASKFSPEMRWGTFPGGSFAWRVKKEKFMEDVKFISDLKFRFGYGKIGNNRIDDYLYLSTFNYGNGSYGLNNQVVSAYTQNALANANLQWESLVNRNYGMDLSLFKGRIDLSVDVYFNTSEKLLLAAKTAPTYGFSSQLQNVGATSNKGYEIQLSAIILRNPKGLNWTANFNIAHNENTVDALTLGQTEFAGGPAWGLSGQPNDYLVKIGSPVGSMYGWVTDGFYRTEDFDYNTTTTQYTLKSGVTDMRVAGSYVVPGAIRFKDISGPAGKPDGIVDDFDKTIIGNPTPKFSGGLNQQFTYKNWDASVFMNFSIGNDIYNANRLEFTSGYNITANFLDVMKDRWKTIDANGNTIQTFQTIAGKMYAFGAAPSVLAAANANAQLWMPSGFGAFGSGGGNFSYYPHSWAIEDGSFLRINNVTIGYTLPIKTIARLHMSKLRFYLTANNLAVITKYTGYDPEVSVRNSGLTPGLDYSAFPKSRTFIFGINATF